MTGKRIAQSSPRICLPFSKNSLTTTHDNLLDFCVADTTEQNAPPARLVNAIESVSASKNLSTDGYLWAYEKISGKIYVYDAEYRILVFSNDNGYISFVKYKLEKNINHIFNMAGAPYPSEINEGVAVD